MSTIRTPWRFRLVFALLIPISLLLLAPLGATSTERLVESTTPVSIPVEIGTAIRIQIGDDAPHVVHGDLDETIVVSPDPALVEVDGVR